MRRQRTLLGAASLIGTLCCGGSNFCNALVLRTGVPRRASIRRARAGGVPGLRASWIDEQVSLEVPASSEDAYWLYSDLRRQPEWSPWLKSVEHDRESGTSKWVIQSNGIKVSWNARNTVEVDGSEVAWESTTGLSNRGRVTFQDKGEGRCLMTLTLSYNLPSVIASVLRLEVVEKFVKRTILSDLSRFKKVLLKQLAGRSATGADTGKAFSAGDIASLPLSDSSRENGAASDGVAAAAAPAAAGQVATAEIAAAPALAPSTTGTASDGPATTEFTTIPASASSRANLPAAATSTVASSETTTTTTTTTATTVSAAAAAAAAAASTTTIPAVAAEATGGAEGPGTSPVTASGGAGSESQGDGATSHAPGRRSRWRRRFRRLLRRDRGQGTTDKPPVEAASKEEERGGRARTAAKQGAPRS